jgi:phosphate transport system protein
MSHFEQRLESDLNAIREWVWSLGEAVETAVRDAKKILVLRDEELAYATVLGDHAINRDSRECDRMCHRFIARHLPGAGHLREMASTIRVNVALERIGDYAVTIAREALQTKGPLPEPFSTEMDAVADESLHILKQSRQAFREGNAEVAMAMMKSSRQVQGKMDRIYDGLAAADDDLDGRTMLVIFVVFSLFKRIADQAKNICDQTVYAVEGIAKIPKIHKVLFLDQPDSGAAQLAVALGRKNFSQVAEFASATPGRSDLVSAGLRAFLSQHGLSDVGLETEPLEAMRHEIADFNLLVCVNGHYSDYVQKVPFHTSALNWSVDGMGPEPDLAEQYRSLSGFLNELMERVAGEHLHQH